MTGKHEHTHTRGHARRLFEALVSAVNDAIEAYRVLHHPHPAK